MVLVDCKNEHTVNWLSEAGPQLRAWKGPELLVRKGEDIPKAHTINVYLPRSKGQDTKTLLKLIKLQNSELATEFWKVMSAKKDPKGKEKFSRLVLTPNVAKILKPKDPL